MSTELKRARQSSLANLCASPLVLVTLLLAVSASAFAQTDQAQAVQQSLAAGIYYANDDFGGSQDTEIWYLPLSYDLDVGNWGFRALASNLRLTGPGNVLVNIGGVTQAVAGSEVTQETGLGDTLLSAVYRVKPLTVAGRALPFVDLRFDVKLPTADERKGLGSGEADYNVQVDLSQNAGNYALFTSFGYTFRGQSQLFPGLEDSAYAQLGLSRPFGEKWSGGLFYDYREQASSFAEEIHEVVPFLSYQLDQNWSLTGLLTAGFTDASAAVSGLIQLNYRW